MTKNKKDPNDLVGFEEFIESLDAGPAFVDRITIRKDNAPDYYTFILNDQSRLKKIATIIGQRLPLYKKFPQSQTFIQEEQQKVTALKAELIDILKRENSPLQKSLAEIFNCFIKKP
jgi:hypothetical protein